MISVVEAAESLAHKYLPGTAGYVDRLRDDIYEALGTVGVSSDIDLDWEGSNRHVAYSPRDAAEELLEKYWPDAGMGAVIAVEKAIVDSLSRLGATGISL